MSPRLRGPLAWLGAAWLVLSACGARTDILGTDGESVADAGRRSVTAPDDASFPPGDAREDWAILRALSDVLGKKLPYDSLSSLRQALYAAYPHFMRIGTIATGNAADVHKLAAFGGSADKAPFRSGIGDFYFTNPIARCSAVMAQCSALAIGRSAMTAAE